MGQVKVRVRIKMEPGWRRRHLTPLEKRVQNQIAEEVAKDARRIVPVDSSELQSTIKARGNKVYVGTDHWWPTEFGSKPHTIVPRSKRALYWPGADHPVKRVRHPGTPEQPFMRPALYKVRHLRDVE